MNGVRNVGNLDIKENCCGCSACCNSCPVDAISMVDDEYGFCYPRVNNSICIGCQKCLYSCDFVNHFITRKKVLASFAAQTKNTKSINSSSSGGVFVDMASQIIMSGGTIFGVVFEKDFSTSFIASSDIKDVMRMSGSKYLQARVGLIYRCVKERLLENKTVLFCGTPCQVAGLMSYLRKDYENLITVDLFCHGVPSQLAFRESLDYVERQYKCSVKSFNFRSKKLGWQGPFLHFQLERNGKLRNKYLFGSEFCFASDFAYSNNLRESCFKCPYSNELRVGDISIGDFWGYQKAKISLDDWYGLSAILVNSEKGLSFLKKTNLVLKEVALKTIIEGNKALQHPAVPGNRWSFSMECIKNNNIDLLQKTTLLENKKGSLKRRIKRRIPRCVLHLFKRIKRRVNTSGNK